MTLATETLAVEDLRTHFFTREGVVKAVDGVTFSVRGGEVLGIAGESGSGKTVTAFSILNLVAPPGASWAGRSRSREGTSVWQTRSLCGSCGGIALP